MSVVGKFSFEPHSDNQGLSCYGRGSDLSFVICLVKSGLGAMEEEPEYLFFCDPPPALLAFSPLAALSCALHS